MEIKRYLPEFAHSLCTRFEGENIPLLLAGGWAVCFHGYSRTTLDVDWICQRSHYDKACELMSGLGFDKATDGMASRFKHILDPSIPFTDLIWVDDKTFNAMSETATQSSPPLPVPMVGFTSLLAMKLYALKDNDERGYKDLLDIRKLLLNNPAVVNDEELRLMCERYATPQTFDMIKNPS